MQATVPVLAWVFGVYIFGVAAFALVVLCLLWPPTPQLDKARTSVRVFGKSITLEKETHILLIVLIAGLIGACGYTLWTLCANVAALSADGPPKNAFKSTQAVWYVFRPWTGCLISLIFYLLVRSGLYAASVGAGSDINVHGMAGLTGAAGFFANTVYGKLDALLMAAGR